MSPFGMVSDGELLRHYVERASQSAFTELVQRHFQVVRRAAERRVGSRYLADDITQRVFTDLARKAPRLANRENVIGWLYTSVRFAAGEAVRAEQRRRARETAAQAMQECDFAPAVWNQLEPWLDEALDDLPERDREALLLHFFESRTFPEVGAALAMNADAARMRVNRALEKLRERLNRRGITSTAAVLGEALLTQTASAAGSSQTARVAEVAMHQGALSAGGGLITSGKALAVLGAVGGAALLFHSATPGETRVAAVPVQASEKTAQNLPETQEAVHVTEETAVDEKLPEEVAVVARHPDSSPPPFSALAHAEKRILKVLWSRELEFGNTPGLSWSTSVAPDKPNYEAFVAARQVLQSRDWVRVVGTHGGAALTEAGLAYCITQRKALEAFPMPKTKPGQRAD